MLLQRPVGGGGWPSFVIRPSPGTDVATPLPHSLAPGGGTEWPALPDPTPRRRWAPAFKSPDKRTVLMAPPCPCEGHSVHCSFPRLGVSSSLASASWASVGTSSGSNPGSAAPGHFAYRPQPS